MQELRKTLKKVAAVGTSLALVGVTVSGALAADLGDLPSPFGNSPSSNVVVFGSDSDNAATDDVVAALGGTPSSGATTTVSSSYAELTLDDFDMGEREDIAVGANIDTEFGLSLDDSDSVGLVDGEVAIDIGTDTEYDFHETINIADNDGDDSDPRLTTALDEGDEEFGSDVVLLMPEDDGDFGFDFTFEEDLDFGNWVNDSTDNDPVTLPFLGKDLVITAATATSITAFAGDKFQLRLGDSVSGVCGGKTVTVLGVGTDDALLEVDGVSDSIDEGDRERISGCEIYVDDVFDSDDDANDRALLVIESGTGEAINTYSNGEEYIGEDDDEYLWSWHLAGLNTNSPTIAVRLNENFDVGEEDDFPDEIMSLGLLKSNARYLMEGDYLCLPNRFACIVMEGMDGDLTWNDYDFDANNQRENLHAANNGTTIISNANVIEVSASGVGDDKGFTHLEDTDTDGSVGDFDKFWIYYRDDFNTTGSETSDGVLIFYEDRTTSDAYLLDLDDDGTDAYTSGLTTSANFSDDAGDVITDGELVPVARFDNGDYDGRIFVRYVDAQDRIDIIVTPALGSSASNLTFTAGVVDGTCGVSYLGDADGEDTTANFTYGTTGIGSWDDDVRRMDGAVVKTPEAGLDNDRVKMEIPNDDEFEYFIRIAQPSVSATSTTTSGGSTVASLSMRDTEVGALADLDKNVVAVGGPAVNRITAELLGVTFPTYGAGVAGLAEGTGILELKDHGTNQALLVFGWDADDTRRAALVVRNADAFELAGKTSATVSGTSLEVSGITVA